MAFDSVLHVAWKIFLSVTMHGYPPVNSILPGDLGSSSYPLIFILQFFGMVWRRCR